MKVPAELAALPVERGARWLALRFLDDAAQARVRMDDPADAEGLHDFRVGLRRLRSLLRAYRRHLDGVRGKDRRRIKELAAATGAARDGEVHRAWLEERLAEGGEAERPGIEWLLARVRDQEEDAEEELTEVVRRFEPERARLERRLSRYEARVRLDDLAGGPTLAQAAAALVLEALAELAEALSRVRTIDDQEEAHEARIAAKRLRYLLEPVAASVEGGEALVKRVKALQEVLGDMHDAHVMLGEVSAALEERDAEDAKRDAGRGGEAPAETDEPIVFARDGDGSADGGEGADAGTADLLPGIEAILGRLGRDREERFAELERDWLGEASAPFFAEARAVADRLASGGDREIERKFLLKRMPRLPEGARIAEIDQGYLPGERLAERVRRVRSGGQTRYFRTIKMGAGISRMEVEEETTEAVFRGLWPLTRGKRVRKRRYKVDDGGLTWEIDRFRDRKLVLAEVELPSEDHPAEPPAWLRRAVERDVTGEPEYVNLNLAR